jgi:spermidine synthase
MNSTHNVLTTKSPYHKLKYIFGLLGVNSLIVQVVLFREFFVTFLGNELSWGIFFATWLLSGAIGSYIYTTFKFRIKNKNRAILSLFILQSLLFFTEIIIVRIIKTGLGYQPNEIIAIEQIFYITSTLIFIPSFIYGGLFSLTIDFTSDILKEDKVRIAGMVYSFEALGFFFAGILFSFILVTYLTSIEIAAVHFLINLTFGGLFLNKDFLLSERPIYSIKKKLLFKITVLAAVVFLFLAVLTKFNVIEKISDYSYNIQWQGFNFLKQVESKYGKITVVEKNGQFNFFQNNNLSFILPDTLGAEQRVHLVMTFHDNPKSVLMFGGLSEDIKELNKYPLNKITYVELDPLIVETAIRYSDHDDSLFFKDNKIQAFFTDTREFIKNTKEKYDVIILNSQEPNSLFSNRHFTKEFYEQISAKLNKGGIFSFSIYSSPAYISSAMYFMQSSIYQTLASSFDNIRLMSSGSLTFISSNDKNLKEMDNKILFDRFLSKELDNTYFNEYLFLDLIENEKNEKRESLLKSEARDIINTDLNPKTYMLNILLLGEESDSVVTKIFNWLFLNEEKNSVIYVLIFILFIIFIIYYIMRCGQKPYLDLYLIVFTSGFVSISIEILMLLLFQILFGYVYYKIGLLIAVFMLGLFIGSYLGNTCFTRAEQHKLERVIIVVEAVFLIYLSITYNFLTEPLIELLSKYNFIIFILLFLASFLAGLEFPMANSLLIGGNKSDSGSSLYIKTGGRLYAFDLFGACIGSAMLTLLFIPFFGICKTVTFLILIKGYSMIFVSTRMLTMRAWRSR